LKRRWPGRPPHSRMNCTPWGTPQRTARGSSLRRSIPCTAPRICPLASIRELKRRWPGRPPHSRMNCAPWGTPQRTARGSSLRRSIPCTAPVSRRGRIPHP